MKTKYLFVLLFASIISSCAPKVAQSPQLNTDVYLKASYSTPGSVIQTDTATLVDSSRNRLIPIATYYNLNPSSESLRKKLVILNPGYGGKNTDYQYIAKNLAVNGYFVVTIQHDLASDDSLPKTGDIYKLRKPFWDRGVKNVFFVVKEIRKRYPQVAYDNITLIGHSNGGDIAMLIANEYPEFARAIISLDNRRVPFPRSNQPKILSIRSNDEPADPGVLPSKEDLEKYKIKIVNVNIAHNDMGGIGTNSQKWKINHLILDFLTHQ
jgi:predicted dienelactone hydrolase